eukprot:TRINITY_DN798_c0_g1_i1.p1 TRINITY_DN798_c0_g1~~TRINITY_DN798_c0_g1_i1.p1  ORF type:complete len:873 (-),score=211.76 TRINITY_DN798_c0_g1_i1:146-2764(-)
MAVATLPARSPRDRSPRAMLPPPKPYDAFHTASPEFGGSGVGAANVIGPRNAGHPVEEGGPARDADAAPHPLDAIRAEAESLAKIRRTMGGRPSQRRVPAAAGKLVQSEGGGTRRASGLRARSRAAQQAAAQRLPLPVAEPGMNVSDELSNSAVLSSSVVPNHAYSRHFEPISAEVGLVESPGMSALSALTTSPRQVGVGQAADASSFDLSGLGNGLERQRLERRQLVEWGENLYQDVSRLEQEKAQLEKQIAKEQADRGALEGELETMRKRCAELELHHEKGEQAGMEENGSLRKQLAAYAVEIDVLRQERETGQSALREAQEAVHRLTLEREGLVRSLQELERSHKDVAQRNDHLEGLLSAHGSDKQAVEGQLHSAMSELGVVGASLQLVHDKGSESQRVAEKAVAEAERSAAEKDERIAALIDVIQPLRDQLHTLKENFVKQTREFGQFISSVRSQQKQAHNAIQMVTSSLTAQWQESKDLPRLLERLQTASEGLKVGQQQQLGEWQRTHKDLQQELGKAKHSVALSSEEHEKLRSDLKIKETKEQLRKVCRKGRLQKILDPNLASQMSLICSGFAILEKVNAKGSKKEHRKVMVDVDRKQLKWCKVHSSFGKGESSVDLAKLIGIQYGCLSRASVLFPSIQPWTCFSVYTTDRSYDFSCRDLREAEAFVCSISRVCAHLGGWSLPGSIQTHHKFMVASGWCKVQHGCRRERKSLRSAIMNSIYATAQENSRRAANAVNTQAASSAQRGTTPPAASGSSLPLSSNFPPNPAVAMSRQESPGTSAGGLLGRDASPAGRDGGNASSSRRAPSAGSTSSARSGRGAAPGSATPAAPNPAAVATTMRPANAASAGGLPIATATPSFQASPGGM